MAPPVSGLSGGELARKLVHIGVGGLAFAVAPLGLRGAVACAVAAIFHNAVLLPRYGGRRLWRDAESARGHSLGIVLYPVAVLLLLLLFHRRLEVAAAAWGLLAFGDGTASLVGMTLGRGNPLPWNPRKSWAGTLAFTLFGGAFAALLLLWTAPGRYEPGFAVAIGFAAATLAALVESLPVGLDDNLGVPLLAGLWLYCLTSTAGGWGALVTPTALAATALGLAVNLALALAAWAVGGVNRSGAVAGVVLGTAIWAGLGPRGFALLFAFFALGTLATRVGYEAKAKRRLAQADGGRRGARNALAKTTVPALAALLAAASGQMELYALAAAGALAAAAADTCASEIGQVYGRRTFLVTSLRAVPPGTEGAVSLEGTLAGIAASFAVGGLGALLGLYPPSGVLVVAVAAFAANTLESLLGATLEQRGLLDNEAVNFLNTLAGAGIAAALA